MFSPSSAPAAAGRSSSIPEPRRGHRGRRIAQAATLHLQVTPGTDPALANGLLHVVVKSGFVDHGFVARRTCGFDGVRRAVGPNWPDRVARITGRRRRRRPVGRGHHAAPGRVGHGGDRPRAKQHSKGTDTTLAFINLALAMGPVGKVGSGVGSVIGRGNGRGGREHGRKADPSVGSVTGRGNGRGGREPAKKADPLPGYRRIGDALARAHVAGVWGRPGDLPGPGGSAYEMLEALGREGGVRAPIIVVSNVVVSDWRAVDRRPWPGTFAIRAIEAGQLMADVEPEVAIGIHGTSPRVDAS